MTVKELKAEQVTGYCNPGIFNFKSTQEVAPLKGFIGQERGAQAVNFALNVKQQGYNLYISGLSGSGKNSYARTVVEESAAGQKVPDDWCYVYNFEYPNTPSALKLASGEGKKFKDTIEKLIENLQEGIPKAFEMDYYENKRALLIKEFQDESSKFMEELNAVAAEMGFTLKRTSQGFATVPLLDGEEVEDLEKLEAEVRKEIEEKSHELQLRSREYMKKIQTAEKEAREKIEKLDKDVAGQVITPLLEEIRKQYEKNQQVFGYLTALGEDLLENIEIFRGKDQETEDSFPWLRWQKGNAFSKYKINLFIDNGELQGAPVIFESNPTYYNLVGRVEHESRWGMLFSDFTMIKAGAMHRANGGYLILQVKDVLQNPGSWEALKRVLRTGEIKIENLGEEYSMFPVSTSRPQPISVDFKIILVGTPYLYHLLQQHDDDFRKMFKVKADFDVEMERTEENIYKLSQFISYHCRQKQLRHFSSSAVAKLVEYSSRMAQNQAKMTTRFNELVEILYEADAWAAAQGAAFVQREHVVQAVEEKRYRNNLIETKYLEMYEDEQLLMDVSGEKTGQINGLSVISSGDFSFGRPTRITVTTFLGKTGIVNIEREIKLSGPIHNKGVLILSGYLGQKYGQKFPLGISANICFEQTYEGIDGDSASSTELYALLSSLAEIPIKQGIAVTGSVNQRGEIQPVGGVTAKVEGFFEVCKRKGLSGGQGVMIPVQNINDLVLREEISNAIAEGKFHIYSVRDIDEGLEVLTGKKAGKKRENGSYPRGSVHYQVLKKVEHYHELLTAFAKQKDDR